MHAIDGLLHFSSFRAFFCFGVRFSFHSSFLAFVCTRYSLYGRLRHRRRTKTLQELRHTPFFITVVGRSRARDIDLPAALTSLPTSASSACRRRFGFFLITVILNFRVVATKRQNPSAPFRLCQHSTRRAIAIKSATGTEPS